MALFKFTQAILDSKPIDVFNHGEMYRDFLCRRSCPSDSETDVSPPVLGEREIAGDSISNNAPWRVVNIGNSKSESLLDFIEALELELGVKAKKFSTSPGRRCSKNMG